MITDTVLIETKHLRKCFEKLEVLKDVNQVIHKGEVVVIIGPSGSGKSTFLRCMNLLERPTSGKVFFEGTELTSQETNLNEIREKMGMVFQSFNLFNNMTVIDNITAGPRTLLKMAPEEATEKAMTLLKKVGLEEKAQVYPANLSGGQKQRVAIVRAMAMNPDMMLFDEPTSALDPEMIGEVLDVIRELAREGMTMAIVTHEMNFAREVGTRLLFMDEGEILEDRDPKEFFASPKHPRAQEFLSKILHE